MPSKKRAAVRKPAAKRSKSANIAPASALAPEPAAAPARNVWRLPIALLMLIVAASGLWLAVHEASNAPQAAERATHETIAPAPAATAAVRAETTVGPASSTDVAAAAPAHAAEPKTVSVTGCVQHSGDSYVLKNAEGTAVQKSRSWKSGFLKRSSPSIELLDSGGARLGSHVGQRVTVVGPLSAGEMRVLSLHRVSATCQ